MTDQNNKIDKASKSIISIVIKKADSIVAISGLFANVGVFGLTIRNQHQGTTIVHSTSTAAQSMPVSAPEVLSNYLGTGIYAALILFAIIIAYGLWKFRSWGWLITVLFSVVCILLVVPDTLNYHAALVSMILLSYITQPAVRSKYME